MMFGPPIDHDDDPDFDAFVSDVIDGVEHDIDADGAIPDLAAVVALAHRMDPQRVPASSVEEVADYAPAVSVQRGRQLRETSEDDQMAAIVAQVRAHVEQEVVRDLHGFDSGRAATPPAAAAPDQRSATFGSAGKGAKIIRPSWVIGLAAAVILFVFGAGVLRATLLTRGSDQARDEALLAAELEQTAAELGEVHVRPDPSRSPTPLSLVAQSDGEADSAANLVGADDARQPEVEASPKRRRRAWRKRAQPREQPEPAETLDVRLDRLHAEGDEAWGRKDYKTAEARKREIIRRGGNRRTVQTAYRDLFSLAKERGQLEKRSRLYREYLKRYPRGENADVAKAGLCRRKPEGDGRVACWKDYLDTTPKGVFRVEALRESAR